MTFWRKPNDRRWNMYHYSYNTTAREQIQELHIHTKRFGIVQCVVIISWKSICFHRKYYRWAKGLFRMAGYQTSMYLSHLLLNPYQWIWISIFEFLLSMESLFVSTISIHADLEMQNTRITVAQNQNSKTFSILKNREIKVTQEK